MLRALRVAGALRCFFRRAAIVRNKQYGNLWRLRINMGNVFFEQKKYSSAIKMYRMALDQVPSTSKEVRARVWGIRHLYGRLGGARAQLQGVPDVSQRIGTRAEHKASVAHVAGHSRDPRTAFFAAGRAGALSPGVAAGPAGPDLRHHARVRRQAVHTWPRARVAVPAVVPQVRFKVMRNIGLAFVRMGQYQDALQAFAQVMDNAPEHQVRPH